MRHEGTVGQLLTRTFAVLVALFVLAGAVEVTVLLLQRRTTEQLIDRVMPLQLANDELRAVLTDGQRSLRGYLLTSDEQMLDGYAAARGHYDAAGRDVRDLSDGRHDERAAARQMDAADAWWAIAERQRLAEPRSAEAADYATRGMTAMDGFLTANRDFQDDLAERAERLHHRNHVLQWIAIAAAVALTVAVALFAVRAAARTRRSITRPLAALVAVLEHRRAGDREVRADPSDGPVEIRAVAEVLNATADESDRIRRDEEEVLARLQAVETVKTDFMATVSHELRTPLTSISGYLELLRDPETGHLTDAQSRMLEVISRNSARLRELIEDMLTLSRIESGDFNSNIGELDLAEVVERATGAIGPAAAKGSVGLHVEVARPLPVIGDGPQLAGCWPTCSPTRSSSRRPRARSRSGRTPTATTPCWWSPTPAWASRPTRSRRCSPASSGPPTPSGRRCPAPGWAWRSCTPSCRTTAARSRSTPSRTPAPR